MTNTTDRRGSAEADLRLAYAVRLLTMPDQDVPRLRTPDGTVQAGQVLFVPVIGDHARNDEVRHYADLHALDMVLIEQAVGTTDTKLALGLLTMGRRSWRYGHLLWRAADLSPATLVCADASTDGHFTICNNRLAHRQLAPWRDQIAFERGLDAARLGLKRLTEGR